MVAANPLLKGGFSVKKFNATVINDIWPEVLFFSLVATMVALVSEKTEHKLSVSNGLLTVLGTVLGLVISFRTSSAYERYQDGRKMWTNISTASRNIAQFIWVHVPNERTDTGKQKKQTVLQSVIEKKSMINLVQAFSVSIKHYLRGEDGVYYQDLYPLIAHLPRYANTVSRTDSDMLPLWQGSEDGEHPYEHNITHRSPPPSAPTTLNGHEGSKGSWFGTKSRKNTFDPEKALASVNSHRPLKPSRNPPTTTFYDYLPIFLIFKPIFNIFSRKKKEETGRDSLGRKVKPQLGNSNVPLEITLYLNNYVAFLLRSGLLQPAIASGLVNNVASLQDIMANLERIGNTPLPFAYQAHLRMSLFLYLFLLPFQLWSAFHYLVIPATAFASFLLLGFLEIGQEIENPFNYDLNDLDLDSFCLSLQRELHEITAHTCPEPSEFVFTGWNQPFAPADRRNAEDLVQSDDYKNAGSEEAQGMVGMRGVLLNNWKQVNEMTRKH
ncbi:Bestrophin, RFP-TM, chloride channel-domain-containing protein [Mycena floridula]|nr:Bestrophin, RFP-TM, chloride channel-domain-containing protein [Mycena floridula]